MLSLAFPKDKLRKQRFVLGLRGATRGIKLNLLSSETANRNAAWHGENRPEAQGIEADQKMQQRQMRKRHRRRARLRKREQVDRKNERFELHSIARSMQDMARLDKGVRQVSGTVSGTISMWMPRYEKGS